MAASMTDPVTTDTVRVYDVTDDGMLRVERLTRTDHRTGVHQRVRAGVVDLEALALFPGDVPALDLDACPDDLAAFGKELVA